MGTPPRERWPIFALAVEERGNLEPFVAEAGVIGERQSQVAGAHDRHLDPAVEAEDLPQVRTQLLDVIADATDAELAEIGEILANLRRVQVELLGQRLRRDRLHAGIVERIEAPQVDRQAIGGQLGDRLEVVLEREGRGGFVLLLHKLILRAASSRSRTREPLQPQSRRTCESATTSAPFPSGDVHEPATASEPAPR